MVDRVLPLHSSNVFNTKLSGSLKYEPTMLLAVNATTVTTTLPLQLANSCRLNTLSLNIEQVRESNPS